MNGSAKIGSRDASNAIDPMISTEANIPRSETIAAIGHRPYTGDLSAIHGQQENPAKESEGNEEDSGVCRKCGHCMQKE